MSRCWVWNQSLNFFIIVLFSFQWNNLQYFIQLSANMSSSWTVEISYFSSIAHRVCKKCFRCITIWIHNKMIKTDTENDLTSYNLCLCAVLWKQSAVKSITVSLKTYLKRGHTKSWILQKKNPGWIYDSSSY